MCTFLLQLQLENFFFLRSFTTMLRVSNLGDGCPQKSACFWATSQMLAEWRLLPCPALPSPGILFRTSRIWFIPVVRTSMMTAGGFSQGLYGSKRRMALPTAGCVRQMAPKQLRGIDHSAFRLCVSLNFICAPSAGSKLKGGEPARSLRYDIRGS